MTDFESRVRAAELALVSSALNDRDNQGLLLANIESASFGDRGLAKLWEALQDEFNAQGRPVYEHEILLRADVSSSLVEEVMAHTDDVVGPDTERHRRCFRVARTLANACAVMRSGQKALSSSVPFDRPDESVEVISRIVTTLQGVASTLDANDEEKDAAVLLERFYDKRSDDDYAVAIPFGVPDLDARLDGGVRPGRLVLILGRSGAGKSALALQVAVNAVHRGVRTCYFCAEMSGEELADRLAALLADHPLNDLKRVRDHGECQRHALPAGMLVFEDTKNILSVSAIVDRERVAGRPFGLAVIDYVQRFRGPGRDRLEQLENIAELCKDIAMKGVAVVAPAQPNREAKPGMALEMGHIRGASRFENESDAVIALNREDAPLPGAPYPVDISLLKSRNGRPGDLRGVYQLGPGTFRITQTTSESGSTFVDSLMEDRDRVACEAAGAQR